MELCPFEQCTGCTACKSTCPKGCITMQPDQYGFLHPVIEAQKCVNCGKCRGVCPVINQKKYEDLHLAFAATHRTGKLLKQSSSGGVFSALAKGCIDQGGVVYGVAFDEQFQVHHVSVNRIDDLAKLRGAKYVQSDLKSSFSEIKEYLEQGKKVLFSGTPCQTAGLSALLGKSYDNLILVDTICHSVPAPLAWKSYLYWIEKKLGGKPTKISFRNKQYGWENYCLSFDGKKHSVREFGAYNYYMQAFLKGLTTRESCNSCKFKGSGHVSDLTLGDFWGCSHIEPKVYQEYGTSLVVAHTQKGVELICSCKKVGMMSISDMNVALQENPAYSQSIIPNIDRDAFLQVVMKDGFETAVSIYSDFFIETDVKKLAAIKRYNSFTNRSKRAILKCILNR